METWKEKLEPSRFAGLSGRMAATISYIADEPYTEPICELVVTRDGFVLAGHVGEVGTHTMIGQESDLLRNWHSLIDGADLTAEERAQAEAAYRAHVHSILDTYH